jgi:prepilin-type N-terminal cleavage/methylation domain-containing protein
MTTDAHRNDEGFTLVEVLVVLSAVGLMSGLMLAMMGQFRHLTAADRQLTQQAALQRTADYIASLLEKAEALPLDVSPNAPVRFMEATHSNVRFLAVARGGAFTFGLSQISISVEGQDGLRQLVQRSAPRRDRQVQPSVIKTIILDQIDNLEFSFLAHNAANGSKLDWHDEWSASSEFPSAIKVHIGTKGDRVSQLSALAIANLQR